MIVKNMLPFVWLAWVLSLCLTDAQDGTYLFNLINKTTQQSSVSESKFGNATSDKAVDGKTENPFPRRSCSRTGKDEMPWWTVDLETWINVYSVTITNRLVCCGRRWNHFYISGSNRSFNPFEDEDQQICHIYNGTYGKGETRSFLCSPSLVARYIYIVLLQQGPLTLCEVEIRAVCPDGTYGEECSENCKNPPCDKFTADGTCPDGECNPGFKGDNCSIVCPDGTYGEKCEYNCSRNCKNQRCDKFTAHGACPDGECNPGFTGDNCSIGILQTNTLVIALGVSLAMCVCICMGTTFTSVRQCMVKQRLNKSSRSQSLPDEFADQMEIQGARTTELQCEADSFEQQEEEDENTYENWDAGKVQPDKRNFYEEF